MSDKTKIIERIKKLIALSKSPNEHEAALAADRVQEMLATYNISMQEVEVDESKSNVGQDSVKEKARSWKRIIHQACARMYFCEYYFYEEKEYVTRRKTPIRYFYHFYVGEPHNILVAQMMSEYLIKTVERLAREGAKTIPKGERNTYLGSFRNSCVLRLRQRIAKRIEETKTTTTKTSEGTTLPALASLYDQASKLNREFIQDNVPGLQTAKFRTRSSNMRGRIDGAIAAEDISLDPQIGGKGGPGHLIGKS